jgi:hypothetical protein
MHNPMVVFATLTCGSICHHWQSLHKPQSDMAIAITPRSELSFSSAMMIE